jgi:hypothetical protein
MTSQIHEDIERPQEAEGSSDRAFGLVFAGAFCLVALLPVMRGGGVRGWALGVAALFLAAALIRPAILHPLNRVWMRVGMILGMVANPIILAILFYLVLVPIGLLMRLVGSRPLQLGFDPKARTYWTPREPGPARDTMNRQF